MLYKVLLTFLLTSSNVLAATLHTILIADTNDTNIGKSTMVDISNMENLVESIHKNTGLSLNIQKVFGNKITKNNGRKNVIKVINELSVNDQDIVIFYYSGHGARLSTSRTRWPSLAVNGVKTKINNLLPLNWIVKQLKQKKPKFFIAIADSCNEIINTTHFATKIGGQKKEAYQRLFLGYKGHIIMSSSKPGQFSFGHPSSGGFFTQAFMTSLNKALTSSKPTWQQILDSATRPINTKYFIQKQQIPQANSKNAVFEGVKTTCQKSANLMAERSVVICKDNIESICVGKGTCKTGGYFQQGKQECCCDNRGRAHCYE